MQNTIQIRKAKVHDSRIIADFNKAMALETENTILEDKVIASGVSNLLNHPERGFYLIAEIEGQIAGSLMITTEWSDWRNVLFWWIQSVYIKPEHRRKGIYRALCNYVKQLADVEQIICGFRLYVEKNNHIAQNTYKSLGMSETHYLVYEEMTK